MADDLLMEMDQETLPELPSLEEVGVLPLHNTVLFPRVVLPVSVGRRRSVALIEYLQTQPKPRYLAIVAQKEKVSTDPSPAVLYEVATLAEVLHLRRQDGGFALIIRGLMTIRLTAYTQEEPFLKARFIPVEEELPTSQEQEALTFAIKTQVLNYIEHLPDFPSEAKEAIRNFQHFVPLLNLAINNLPLNLAHKQKLLEESQLRKRAEDLLLWLEKELQVMEMTEKILQKVRSSMDQQQKDYLLRQQIKALQEELGDLEGDDFQRWREKAQKKKWTQAAQEAFEREIQRLSRMMPGSPEYTVSLSYIEWLLDLPWHTYTTDRFNLAKARRILDQHHYGMEKAKKRILEYLAVLKLRGDMKAPILCFYGPPGVGKTSIAQAIAQALGRKFTRMALGGLSDEAELRGHRRTYIGAMPGRILQNLRRVGTSNPVFLLDEIDKVGRDFRGDPASALLEILDPELNTSFQDHYVEVDYDLSKVLFIATANSLDTIHPALRDRLEIIELNGYTLAEKTEIARRHLVPKALQENGVPKKYFMMTQPALETVIAHYTRESGVRQLYQQISSIARYVAMELVADKMKRYKITPDGVYEILGAPRYEQEIYEENLPAGVAVGLAWTPFGGDILFIEAVRMEGQGKLTLSGQLGEVMQESAHIAYTFLRSHAERFELNPEVFKKFDYHVHVPSGAVPKDGPSAGVAILSALASLLTGRTLKPRLAMSGEITLRGKILPVGGIKEKLLAAHRAGIRKVFLPTNNQKDVKEIEPHLLEGLEIVFVQRMENLLAEVLEERSGNFSGLRISSAQVPTA
ncbi:MAG: endopeptidase La [Bacteroidia bacterium]